MNWYYMEHERNQRKKDWEKTMTEEQLIREAQSVGGTQLGRDTSEKRSFPANRFGIVLVFATIGHWLFAWRR